MKSIVKPHSVPTGSTLSDIPQMSNRNPVHREDVRHHVIVLVALEVW